MVHCDKILVLRDGAVAEEGTHSELLLDNPDSYYSKLWQSQHTTETKDDSTKTMTSPEHHHHHHHHHDHEENAGCGHAHH